MRSTGTRLPPSGLPLLTLTDDLGGRAVNVTVQPYFEDVDEAVTDKWREESDRGRSRL
jgi:hypothetical protein